MKEKVFFLILRSVGIPLAAVYLLSQTALGREGALIAVGLALLVTNIIGIGLNLLKLLGNTVLLRPKAVLYYIGSITVQVLSVFFIWIYYFAEYHDLFE